MSLQWRHNERDGVSNKSQASRLLNRLLGRRSKKKNQSSASLAFVRGIHRWPVNSPHKGPVTRKMFPFDDVIMYNANNIDNSYIYISQHKYVNLIIFISTSGIVLS